MPLPDPPSQPRKRRRLPIALRDALDSMADFAKRRRRGRRKDLDDGGVPVEPNKPKNLSGGAAAALEFEDDSET
jgi:hypothetical protein